MICEIFTVPKISVEPVGGILPNLHDFIIWARYKVH